MTLNIKCYLQKPWIRTDNAFRRSLTLCFPCSPSRGGKDSECVNPTGEGIDSVCTVPTGGGKDSVCTAPTGEGKDSVCTVPSRGRENSVCTGYIQPSSVQKCTYPRKVTKAASWGQTKAVPSGVGKARLPPVNNMADKRRIQVALQRMPKLIQGTLHSQQLRRLRQTKCLMDLYSRPAAERRSQSRSYPDSLRFYSRLFLVPKPGNHWRPVIDLSALNKFLAIPKFKMETPESIRASLRKGEWVTSIDLTDTCLHVPIQSQSQKYLRFHFQGVTYQFTSLPFGLATAPLIFTSIIKEVKLIALQSGIRLHQYLDDWLIRARMHGTNSKTTKTGKGFGFIVNLKKSELVPSQRFDFLGYHFLLDLALVKPTQDRWTKLQEMFHRLSLKSVISARTLMSTIGLLASMEKTVKLGRMHMRPFQWHLKTHWKYPMPLDTPIPWNQKMTR